MAYPALQQPPQGQYYGQQPQYAPQYAQGPPPGYPGGPVFAQGVPVAAYGGPPQGFPGSATGGGQGQTIIVMEQQPQQYMVMPQGWGFAPVSCVCPNCRSQVVTSVSTAPGAMAWISGLILAIVFLPLACVPCCIESCQDVTHSCPACGTVIRRRGAGEDW